MILNKVNKKCILSLHSPSKHPFTPSKQALQAYNYIFLLPFLMLLGLVIFTVRHSGENGLMEYNYHPQP